MEQEKYYFKKGLSLLLCLVMVISVFSVSNTQVSSATTSHGFEYEIDYDNKAVFLFGCTSDSTEIVIPDMLYGMPTTIGYEFYLDCPNVEVLTIPNNLSFWAGNFYNCKNLKKIIYTGTKKEWYGMSDLGVSSGTLIETTDTTFTFQEYYRDETTGFCYMIYSDFAVASEFFGFGEIVEIPESIKGVPVEGTSDYFSCYGENLTQFIIPKTIVHIRMPMMIDVYAVDSDNQSYLFENGVLYNKDKTKIVRASIASVPNNYIMPDSVVAMEPGAFYLCNIVQLTLSENLEEIPTAAFAFAERLVSITIPSNVKLIGDEAFSGCINLESIYVNSNNTEYVVENNILYNKDKTILMFCPPKTKVTNIIVPDSVEIIASSAFSDSCIKSVTMGNNVKRICSSSFSYCGELESVELSENLQKIEGACFYSCDSLKNIVIPEYVSEIDYNAFAFSDSLENIYFKTNYIKIDYSAFYECTAIKNVYFECPEEELHLFDEEYNQYLFNCNMHFSATDCDFYGHTYKNGECVDCGLWQYKNTAVKLGTVKNTTSGVYITWSKLPGADKYAVYRKTTGGWTKLTASATGTSFTDKTAKNNVKYTYTVRAINGTEYNTTYNKTGLKITFMSAPKITSVTNAATGVTVKWGKVSGATVYYVYRKTTGGWTKLGSTKSTSFTDKKAKAGTKYTYTIIAAKSGAKSSYYGGKAIVRLTVPKLTKLTATSKKNTLTYGKVTGATSYIIYRKTNNGGWQKIATTKSTKYVDTKVKKGTYYTYTVKAVNGSYTSYYNTKGLKVKAK